MANDQLVIAELIAEPTATVHRPTAGLAMRYHKAVLGFTLIGLASLLLFEVTPGGFVRVPLLGMTLRGLCAWQFFFAFDCPLCGLTRCFVSMAHCRPLAAWHFHAAGVGLFALVLSQVPYRIVQIRRLAQGRAELRHAAFAAAIWLLAAAFALQWIVKIVRLLCG
jgi:hypothetical protein